MPLCDAIAENSRKALEHHPKLHAGCMKVVNDLHTVCVNVSSDISKTCPSAVSKLVTAVDDANFCSEVSQAIDPLIDRSVHHPELAYLMKGAISKGCPDVQNMLKKRQGQLTPQDLASKVCSLI